MTKRSIPGRGARGSSRLKTGDGVRKSLGKAGIFKPSCLSLDLEVGKKNNRIHAFAAVRADTGQLLVFPGGDLRTELTKLDSLAEGASFLLGHNLINFDLPHLAAVKTRFAAVKTPFGRYALAESSGVSPQSLSPSRKALSGRWTETRTEK